MVGLRAKTFLTLFYICQDKPDDYISTQKYGDTLLWSTTL